MAIIKIVVFTIGITFGLSEFIQAQPQSDFNLTQILCIVLSEHKLSINCFRVQRSRIFSSEEAPNSSDRAQYLPKNDRKIAAKKRQVHLPYGRKFYIRCTLEFTGETSNFMYLGKWHQVGLLFPETPKNGILCEWFTVEEHNCRGCFGEKYGELLTGEVRPKLFGTGLFEWPKIMVAYRDYFYAAFTYFVTCYNNNNDLILRDKNNLKYSKMLSRNTTVSSEARKAFESMAESAGLQAVFVDPTKC